MMARTYDARIIENAQKLRRQGMSYPEISKILGIKVPKSTFSHWFRDVTMSKEYFRKSQALSLKNLAKGRSVALQNRKERRVENEKKLRSKNHSLLKLFSTNK